MHLCIDRQMIVETFVDFYHRGLWVCFSVEFWVVRPLLEFMWVSLCEAVTKIPSPSQKLWNFKSYGGEDWNVPQLSWPQSRFFNWPSSHTLWPHQAIPLLSWLWRACSCHLKRVLWRAHLTGGFWFGGAPPEKVGGQRLSLGSNSNKPSIYSVLTYVQGLVPRSHEKEFITGQRSLNYKHPRSPNLGGSTPLQWLLKPLVPLNAFPETFGSSCSVPCSF